MCIRDRCSITLYFAVPKLILVWLGEEYIMPQLVLILMSIHIFILQARLTVTNFKDAYGLFQDEMCIRDRPLMAWIFRRRNMVITMVMANMASIMAMVNIMVMGSIR